MIPKVSICIPAYKNVDLLNKAIISINIQTYKDYEIVITDDSPDNNVQEYVVNLNNPKIRYFKNAINLGSPENWNEAIKRAKGQYIKILHHDDWLSDASSLEKYVSLLDQNPTAEFAFSASHVIFENGPTWDNVPTAEQIGMLKENPTVILKGNFIGAPSATIFKKTNINLFDKNLKWVVDIEFYIRVLSHNNSFAFSSEPLITTFGAEGRISDFCANNNEIEIFEYFYLLNKMIGLGLSNKISSIKGFQFIWELCKKYNIQNIKEIRKSKYFGSIPHKLRILFFTNSLSKRLGQYYSSTM